MEGYYLECERQYDALRWPVRLHSERTLTISVHSSSSLQNRLVLYVSLYRTSTVRHLQDNNVVQGTRVHRH
jgi:hypothetical protein